MIFAHNYLNRTGIGPDKVSKMKVQADNVNGVYKVDDFEGEVMSQEDFYEALPTNPEDSVISANIDDAMTARIEEEYGIH